MVWMNKMHQCVTGYADSNKISSLNESYQVICLGKHTGLICSAQKKEGLLWGHTQTQTAAVMVISSETRSYFIVEFGGHEAKERKN